MTLRKGMTVAALGAALTLALPASGARADVIERVVAVVNDDAIFLSDLRRRAVPFLDKIMSASGRKQRVSRLRQLYERLLDKLVEERLIRQAAERMQVRVTGADVERAINNVQRKSGLSGQQFWRAVRRQGMTEAQYRSDLKRQLLRLKVLNKRVRGQVNINEADVRERYEKKYRKKKKTVRFHASHCILGLPDDASSSEVAEVRAQAQDIRKDLTRRGLERCIQTHGGTDLGWLSQGDLNPKFEKALEGLEPGAVSDPVRGPGGFHIFMLHERKRGSSDIPPYEQVRDQLFRKMLDEAMARQEKQFLSELRRKAVIDRRL